VALVHAPGWTDQEGQEPVAPAPAVRCLHGCRAVAG
jgi:hypothetical protein